jgi:hypothetical protein
VCRHTRVPAAVGKVRRGWAMTLTGPGCWDRCSCKCHGPNRVFLQGFIYVPLRAKQTEPFSFPSFFFFFVNSGFHACKARALSLESLLQSTLLRLFWRWGLLNCLPRLALNCSPPHRSLPSSWEDRREHQGSNLVPYLSNRLGNETRRDGLTQSRVGHTASASCLACLSSAGWTGGFRSP